MSVPYRWAQRAQALLFPRRCPFCGALLGPDAVLAAVCPDCAPQEERLRHIPPRLPQTEHTLSGVSSAFGAYYYADEVRHAILLCKRYGHPWYAREMADLAAVRAFGAQPARRPGEGPLPPPGAGLPLYSCLVPVPPRSAGPSLPDLLARRLGRTLGIPVMRALRLTRQTAPQKTLDRAARMRNARDAYAVWPGMDMSGRRVLLVDDIITTGATISACAQALLLAGAADVAAFCLAADEELPKEKQNA